MENASKALIIAGAILLAIVLVSLGVLVINNARKDITGDNLAEATAEAFNSKISAFCGRGKSMSDVNNLINAVFASNAAQKNKAEKHYIQIDCKASGTKSYGLDASGAALNVKGVMPLASDPAKTHDVNPFIDANGYIYKINIWFSEAEWGTLSV